MQIPTFLGVSRIILFELHGVGLSTFLMMPAFSYLWRPLFSTAPFATGMWRMAVWMGARPGLMVKCTGRPQPTDARGRVTLTIVPVGPGCHQGRMQSLWVHPCWVGGGIRLHHIFNCFPSCRAGSWEFWWWGGGGDPRRCCGSPFAKHTLLKWSSMPHSEHVFPLARHCFQGWSPFWSLHQWQVAGSLVLQLLILWSLQWICLSCWLTPMRLFLSPHLPWT